MGIEDGPWASARSEMRRLLVARARTRGQIAYSELLAEMTTLDLSTEQPRDRAVLKEMLCEIGEAEHQAGRPLLTSIVVHKTGNMEPGLGFFELAERLGLQVADEQAFWLEQMKATHAHWAT